MKSFVCAALAISCLNVLWAQETTLYAVQFPERRQVELDFTATSRAPQATLKAEVVFEKGQAEIELKYKKMKPAVLFGGDITCYVVWAVMKDGTTENLGELGTLDTSDKITFFTSLKNFGMMVTAEPYYLVRRPSPLVLFTSNASEKKQIVSVPFAFNQFGEKPNVGMESIAMVALDSKISLELVQAEKAFELAGRYGAETYAPSILRDAKVALGQAENYSAATKKRELIDFARRSVSHSNEAIRWSIRKKEAEELAKQIAERQAAMRKLEEKASAAEGIALKAQQSLLDAQTSLQESQAQKAEADLAIQEAQAKLASVQLEKQQLEAEKQAAVAQMELSLTQMREEKTSMTADLATMNLEKQTLAETMTKLREEQKALEASNRKLQEEKASLNSRLQDALSNVAETKDSARGFIVNLPDILFDVNEASLKPGAKVVIAKLVGILLVMPDLNLRIEGHTDSTGSADYNLKLSRKRAESVLDFLKDSGIEKSRMDAVGYGKDKPIASNDSDQGRRKNRRVEIVINSGKIEEGN